MKGKVRRKLMWMQLSILIAVTGGGALIYYLAAPFYHSFQRNQLIWEAYHTLGDMDLNMLEYSDESTLWQYEEQNVRITISNEEFYPVYTTWAENMEHQVYRHIVRNKEEFSKTPQLISGESGQFSVVKLMGLLEQDGETFYVSIRVKKVSGELVFRNTELVLAVFLLALVISVPILYIYFKHVAQPFEEILDGTNRIVQSDFHVNLSEDGVYRELNCLARNINWMTSHLQKMENQDGGLQVDLGRDKEMLENIRKDVVADISHELKTPLAIISSQVEMLQCMDDRIDRSYYYSSIVEEVSRMSDMVGELMDLSLLEQNLQKMEKCEINLTDIMEYIRLKYQALFGQNHIKGEFSLEPECCVWGNAHYLEQALDNYIMNAFSHTAQGNCIRVCLYRKNGWAHVTVYNQGEHIEPSDMERIWQGYVMQRPKQETAQDRPEQRHMGIGLYLVRRIIRLHQGECGVENKDKGVEFWFKVPCKHEKQG